jgi:hypothetical protein
VKWAASKNTEICSLDDLYATKGKELQEYISPKITKLDSTEQFVFGQSENYDARRHGLATCGNCQLGTIIQIVQQGYIQLMWKGGTMHYIRATKTMNTISHFEPIIQVLDFMNELFSSK